MLISDADAGAAEFVGRVETEGDGLEEVVEGICVGLTETVAVGWFDGFKELEGVADFAAVGVGELDDLSWGGLVDARARALLPEFLRRLLTAVPEPEAGEKIGTTATATGGNGLIMSPGDVDAALLDRLYVPRNDLDLDADAYGGKTGAAFPSNDASLG